MTDRYYVDNRIKSDVPKKSDYHCWYCGVELFNGIEHRLSSKKPEVTLDHFIPLAICGKSGVDNLVPACRSCNSQKGKSDIESFRTRLINKYGKGFIFYFEKKGLTL